jgi:nucleotide-binding universal stress UspA family protein
MAKALELKVTLLRVAGTAEEFIASAGYQHLYGVSALHTQNFEGMAKQAGNQALDYLKGLEVSLRRQGIDSVEHRIERGQAAQAIVNVAVETPYNLVAMTTHGRTGSAKWVLGSVTERVVRHSGDPVLVVRTQ